MYVNHVLSFHAFDLQIPPNNLNYSKIIDEVANEN